MDTDYESSFQKYIEAHSLLTQVPQDLVEYAVQSIVSIAQLPGLDAGDEDFSVPAGVSTVIIMPSGSGKQGVVESLRRGHDRRDDEIAQHTRQGDPNVTMMIGDITWQKQAHRFKNRDTLGLITSEGNTFFAGPSWQRDSIVACQAAHNAWLQREMFIFERKGGDVEIRVKGAEAWCVATQPMNVQPLVNLAAASGLAGRLFPVIRRNLPRRKNKPNRDPEHKRQRREAKKVMDEFHDRIYEIRSTVEGEIWIKTLQSPPRHTVMVDGELQDYMGEEIDKIIESVSHHGQDSVFYDPFINRMMEYGLRILATEYAFKDNNLIRWNDDLKLWMAKNQRDGENFGEVVPPEILIHRPDIDSINYAIQQTQIKWDEFKNFHENIETSQEDEIESFLRQKMGSKWMRLKDIQNSFWNSSRPKIKIREVLEQAARNQTIKVKPLPGSSPIYKWPDENDIDPVTGEEIIDEEFEYRVS